MRTSTHWQTLEDDRVEYIRYVGVELAVDSPPWLMEQRESMGNPRLSPIDRSDSSLPRIRMVLPHGEGLHCRWVKLNLIQQDLVIFPRLPHLCHGARDDIDSSRVRGK